MKFRIHKEEPRTATKQELRVAVVSKIIVRPWLAVLMAICVCGPVFAQPPINYFQFGSGKSDKAYSVSATLEGVYVVGRTDGTLAGPKERRRCRCVQGNIEVSSGGAEVARLGRRGEVG